MLSSAETIKAFEFEKTRNKKQKLTQLVLPRLTIYQFNQINLSNMNRQFYAN